MYRQTKKISSIGISVVFELYKAIFTYLQSTIVQYVLTPLNGKFCAALTTFIIANMMLNCVATEHFHCAVKLDLKSAKTSGQCTMQHFILALRNDGTLNYR